MARVHRWAWRRGCVAGGGAGAANGNRSAGRISNFCLMSNLLLRSTDKTIVVLGVLQIAFSRD